MSILFLIRGLPGSGKSTLARELSASVYEADQFFINSEGEYKFDRNELGKAHQTCQENVEKAMYYGYNRIAVSNTFTQRWEMEVYINLAAKYQYRVVEVTLSGPLYENTHGVPAETIEAMRKRWEV